MAGTNGLAPAASAVTECIRPGQSATSGDVGTRFGSRR